MPAGERGRFLIPAKRRFGRYEAEGALPDAAGVSQKVHKKVMEGFIDKILIPF